MRKTYILYPRYRKKMKKPVILYGKCLKSALTDRIHLGDSTQTRYTSSATTPVLSTVVVSDTRERNRIGREWKRERRNRSFRFTLLECGGGAI